MTVFARMRFETLFHSGKTVHGTGCILHLHYPIRVPEQYVPVYHLDLPEFDGGSILYEAYPESESSWDNLLNGIRPFLVEEHRIVSRADKRELVARVIKLKKYGRDEYPSFEFLLQLIVESDEKVREHPHLFREFEEQLGEEGDGKTGLYSMPCRIAYIEERFIPFFIVSEGIADNLVLPVNFSEKVEPLEREIVQILGKPTMHNREQFRVGAFIRDAFYGSRSDQELLDIFQSPLSLEVLLLLQTLELGIFYENRYFLEE